MHSKFTPALLSRALYATALAAGIASAPATWAADTVELSATLNGASEVPANSSAGTGTLNATLDKSSNQLKWMLTYSGLSGPATAAHFHGPAAPGANSGVVVPFKTAVSPIEGTATLTPEQAADLLAGKWYANVHSAANPGGEIRGQVTPAK